MSLVKYILQSCYDESRYRIIFINSTHLNVGETWDIQCTEINSGCYTVMEDTGEVLDEIYGDDCTFIEYNDCLECSENYLGITVLNTLESCQRWTDCDTGTQHIYTPQSYNPPDSTVLYYGVCYSFDSPPLTVLAEPTDLSSLPNSLFFGKCDACEPCFLDCNLDFGGLSPSPTPTITSTPEVTLSNTPTPSITQTPSNTATPSVTQTPSNTATPSVTQTPSNTTTPSVTMTPDASPSSTPTQTPSNTTTPSNTATPSVTQTPSNTVTPSNTATPSVTQTPSNTTTPSVTQTPDASPSSTPTQTPSNTSTPSVTQTPSNTTTPSVTQTPSNTTTPSVTQTPSNTVTPSVTQTPSQTKPLSYSRFSLTPCCDNYQSSVTVLTEANILDSLGVTQGNVISLDNVCYTIGLGIPGTSSNTPSSQVLYNDCETCVSSQPQQYWCVYTYVACFEDQYGAGELMAAPVRYNTLLNTTNPVGGLYEHLQFTHTVTNIASQNVSFDDCYTYDSTYDETLPITLYSGTHNGCCDSSIGSKCSGAYVVLESCDTYYGNVTPLNGGKLDSLVLMGCDFVSNSSIGGGVVQITDTINAPQLLGNVDYLGTVQDQIILEDGFSGICFTIVGETTTIKTAQNQLQGTDWVTNAEVVVDCNSTNCHCLSNIGVENFSSSPVTLEYLQCGVTGSGNQDSISIPAGGTITITDCINVNSVVLSRTNIPSFDVGDIQFNFDSSTPCTEYTYFTSVSLCCDSTDTPITGSVGILNSLGVTTNDYVVINGDAYQITGTITTTGTEYTNVTGPYTSCSNAVANADNPCRYDMEPCCSQVNGPSYYPPFTLEINEILNINDSYFTQVPPPYSNVTDKCMSVQNYTGNYAVDSQYQNFMQPNGSGCINRCSRCSYTVTPCGWPSNYFIIWTVNPLPGMIPGSVWHDDGLANWIVSNGYSAFGVTNCLTIINVTNQSYLDHYGNAYISSQNNIGNCSDSSCSI